MNWSCSPEVDSASEIADDFGNRVIELRHARISRDWEFSLELVTQRDSLDAPLATNLPPQGIGAFLLPSARCDRTPLVCEAAQRFAGTVDIDRTLHDVCEWTHRTLRYDEAARGEVWTASQALERGAGVCADYAHLMIAVCRILGIPARYVAGYNPAEGAMHAWCEALDGETWRAFDPTHGRATRTDCVFVAVGRDERDCPPLRGSFQGRAVVTLDSWCKTTVVQS